MLVGPGTLDPAWVSVPGGDGSQFLRCYWQSLGLGEHFQTAYSIRTRLAAGGGVAWVAQLFFVSGAGVRAILFRQVGVFSQWGQVYLAPHRWWPAAGPTPVPRERAVRPDFVACVSECVALLCVPAVFLDCVRKSDLKSKKYPQLYLALRTALRSRTNVRAS